MVGDDLLDSMDDGGDSSSSNNSSNKKSSSSSGSSTKKTKADVPDDQEPFRLTEESKLQPEDMEVSEGSMELAANTESGYDVKGGEGFKEYVRRQKKECKELHQDMKGKAEEYSESTQKFTLIFHAMVWNFAQNRVGIYGVLKGEFGLSHSEALDTTNKIVREAGEVDMLEEIVKISTENMID